jgi:urea transport system permease protein
MLNRIKYSDVSSILILLIILFIFLPLFLDSFRLNLVGKYISFAFVAIGIVLTWGYGGILSLGQGVFFGMGGYMMAMFLKLEASGNELPDFMVWSSVDTLPIPWIPFNSLIFTFISILILPALIAYIFSYAFFLKRVSGVYFAIVTLCLALAMTVIIIGQQGSTGGANGITDFESILGWNILTDESLKIIYYLSIIFLAIASISSILIINSRYGKILIAIRDSENRVRFSGYNTAHMKAFIFAIGALLASIGGAFFTLQSGLISPTAIGVVASVEMVIYAAVGGRLSIAGAIFGALSIGFLKSYLSETFPQIWLYFLGFVFIFVVWIMPNGLAGLTQQFLSIKRKKSII